MSKTEQAKNEAELQLQEAMSSMTFWRAFKSGVCLKCPICTCGALFRSLFRMRATCPECDFPFERPSGYFLGSTYINYGATAVLTTISYVVLHFGLGWDKDILLPGLLTFCLIFPLVFFRFARSLWLSLDCYFDRVGASEVMQKSSRRKNR